MRTRLASILAVVLMAFTLLPAAVVSNAEPAQAVDVINCTSVRIDSGHVEIKCTAAGIIVLDTTVNLPPGPTVTLPPLPGTTVTVHVPGPSQTQTIKVPIPGPTQTVHVTATVSVRPSATPEATVTTTETVPGPTTTITTGQVDNGGGTIDQEPDDPVVSIPNIDSPAEAAGIGAILFLILMALILLGLYLGYILGYKDSDRKSADFIQAMLDKVKKG